MRELGRLLVGEADARLQRQINHCLTSPFYRERFEEVGVDPTRIRTLEDLRQVPILVTPDLHRTAQDASREADPAHPFGTFLCVRPDEVVAVSSTSGTTGDPTFYPFTRNDVEQTDTLWLRALRFMGVRPGDIVLQGFGLSMYLAGLPLVRAVERLGATPIPIGAEAGTEKLLRMARTVRPRVLCCTPSYAEYLIERAPEVLNGMEARDLGIEILICAGEPGAGLPEVRAKLEDGWGARVHDVLGGTHGVMMVSGATAEYHGMVVLGDDYSVATDLVDPSSKEPIDLVHGAIGERVKTALQWEAAPPLRYSVGDVYELLLEPVDGLPALPRVKVIGRVDDLLIVKGVKVYPAAIADVVNRFVPEVTGQFRIVLAGPPPKVTPPLTLEIEHGAGLDADAVDSLTERIIRTMHDRLTITPRVTMIEPGTIERSAHKKKLIEIRTT